MNEVPNRSNVIVEFFGAGEALLDQSRHPLSRNTLFALVNTLNVRYFQGEKCVKQSGHSFAVPSGCDSNRESL